MKGHEARGAYEQMAASLDIYADKELDLDMEIHTDTYPISFEFSARGQMQIFQAPDDNVDKHGEANRLVVTVGIAPKVENTLRFRMNTADFKKLIRQAEKLAALCYQASYERERRAEQKTMQELNDLRKEYDDEEDDT